jgi:broad specificity phosphatase PhoE
MKWPKSITLIRHGKSKYNNLRGLKEADADYKRFKRAFERNYQSQETLELARFIKEKYPVAQSDYETALTEEGILQARTTAKALSQTEGLPDVIFYSPYLRTRETFSHMREAWPELKKVKNISEDRIREQEHGLSLLYNDWRLFQVFHPEQKLFRDLQGPYWYQHPQGESISQVRDRIRSMVTTLIREWSEKDVWLITHHLTILSIRGNIERLSPEEFIRLDEEEKPINCGITRYICNPNQGKDGKLELTFYNKCLF